MIKIDKLYLEEARRIRKDYLKSIKEIKKKEVQLIQYKDEVEKLRDEIEELYNSDVEDSDKDKIYVNKMEDLIKNITKIEKEMAPFYNNIKKLDSESIKLKESINARYPEITIEDIKKQIIPYVEDLK